MEACQPWRQHGWFYEGCFETTDGFVTKERGERKILHGMFKKKDDVHKLKVHFLKPEQEEKLVLRKCIPLVSKYLNQVDFSNSQL